MKSLQQGLLALSVLVRGWLNFFPVFLNHFAKAPIYHNGKEDEKRLVR